MRRLMVLAITIAVVRPASGHVAPSVDDNNRYLKVTPQRDRIRLAYTVFFGEVPGAQARPGMDRDHDGTISEAEAQAFGAPLAKQVADALEASVDGATQPIVWAEVAVGLGSPRTQAGAFSIDLISYLCLGAATTAGPHRLLLKDRFRVPRPGETELKVEDAPGITITKARIGTADDPGHDFKFAGPGGPLSDDGLEMTFTVSDRAPPTSESGCVAPSPPPTSEPAPSMPGGMIIALGATIGFVLAAVVTLLTRRRRRT